MVYILLSLFSGCLVLLSMVFNSQLAKRAGVFNGTLVNYVTGFVTTLAVLAVTGFHASNYIGKLGQIPFWAFLGGLLGVAVVAASNVIVPKVPTVYVTILTFSGQLLAGVAIDLVLKGKVSFGEIIGVILIILGLAYNTYIDATSMNKEPLLQEDQPDTN